MSFKDIKGQDRVISFLKSSLENERTSHAYIFLGPRGVGRRKVALNFAKALNCYAELSDRPCDSCIACRKIDNFNHPDIFLLKPELEGSSIKIDDMRELIRSIGLKPYEARKKLYLIDDAGSMTQEASNALLKTLEEPPPNSILILIAEDLGALFQTIISRSQVVRFAPLELSEVKEILISKYNIDSMKAHISSRLSSGSIGEALRFKDEEFFNKRSELIDGLLKNTFFVLDFEETSKEDLKLLLRLMLTWYRDILVTKVGLGDSMLINIDRKDAISDAAKMLEFDYLDTTIKEIISTNYYLDQNANSKLAMGVLGLKIQGI